jgi:hygromycin-B 7''-O-kinase
MAGTNPVFIVNGTVVVKLFTDLFGGPLSAPTELACYQLLTHDPAFPAPSLLAHGELFADGWPWPYVVTSVMPGMSLGEAGDHANPDDRRAAAAFLGRALRRLHDIPLGPDGPLAGTWDRFAAFLTQQRQQVVDRYGSKDLLSQSLGNQLNTILPSAEELIDRTDRPLLIHADLNRDHLLGTVEPGGWRPTGIIDFGDAMMGSFFYELQALHIGLFRCEGELLRIFLNAYNPPAPLLRDLPRRATAMMLLHRFDMLETALQAVPAIREAQTLDALAALVWGV